MNYETPIYSDSEVQYQETPRSGNLRYWIVAALVLLAVLVGGLYWKSKNTPGAKTAIAADKKAQAQTVSVIAPGQDTVLHMIEASGTLAARREIPVGVVGEGGLVARVFVDAGDWVRQGQVLVSIERSVQSQQIVGIQSQINSAQADVRLTQSELDRAAQLVERGFISKADIERKTAARDSARARLGIVQAQLKEAQARNARLDIRAPTGGYILERHVEPGQTVGQGTGMLFRLAKAGEMELQAQLNEADLASISVGVPATVTPTGTELAFNGTVWQISPMINAQSRQGIARVALPFNRALRPGGFASVKIQAGAQTAPVLPESALQSDANGNYVYIVGGDNKVARRNVKTGEVTASGIPVIDGLDGTERVVVYAGGFLNPGETINPKILKKQ